MTCTCKHYDCEVSPYIGNKNYLWTAKMFKKGSLYLDHIKNIETPFFGIECKCDFLKAQKHENTFGDFAKSIK